MKNVSLLLNAILTGIICFLLFKKPESVKSKQTSCTTICMDYSGTSQFKMNSNVLKMMTANYLYGNSPAMHNTLGDAKSVWFSLRTLKTFLWQIESEVCKKNSKCSVPDSLLGVRIYYARYPDNSASNGTAQTLWSQYPSELGSLPANYAKQHTFFMVPTFDINGTHYDFDPFQTLFAANCTPLRTLSDILGKDYKMNKENLTIYKTPLNQGIQLFGLMPASDPAAKNHGELCPPYPQGQNSCPGAYFQ